MNQKPLNIVDLFSGAGGLSEGFRLAGFESTLAIELDPFAAASYQKNHPNTSIIVNDISKISNAEILAKVGNKKIHIVAGGPPCQGFSNANRRKKISDERNILYLEFLRVVKLLSPDFFVMENVRGFASAKLDGNKTIIEDIQERVGKAYTVDFKILVAADYGVPQLRNRVFVIGRKGKDPVSFPKPTHTKNIGSESNCPSLSEWETVGKCLLPRNKVPSKFYYSKKLIKGFVRREKLNKKRHLGFKWQFLDKNKPSYTIPARYYKDGANALVKYSDQEIRKLTPSECALIQSFPSEYQFMGPTNQVYRQIGNAVPPLLAKAIAQEIRNCAYKLNDK